MGSIRMVLLASYFSQQDLLSLAGGFAAAIAIGAFLGQARSGFRQLTDLQRRRDIAIGGFFGVALLIALFLVSGKWE